MSITPERLRALTRQAGAPVDGPRNPPAGVTNGSTAGGRAQANRVVPVANPDDVDPGTAADVDAGADRHSTPRMGAGSAAAARATRVESLRASHAPMPIGATGAAPPAAPTTAADPLHARPGQPLDFSGRVTGPKPSIESLRRLLGVRERKPEAGLPPRPRGPVDRSLPGVELAPGLLLIEAHLPFPAPDAALPLAFARREDTVDPRALLFFDTETTGLAGGTGTRAFQIGAADWHHHPAHGDGLRIRQLLITTLAAEPAMLREFATWLTPATVLCSYNGRSYDAPLLKTRYRLARLGDPITPLDHLDLLHPTRRRYRGVWENCRLATIERELLKIIREDDLPGSEAPAAWLSFLRGGASGLLRRVCAHNHQDVVTLARLLLRLVEVHAEVQAEAQTEAQAPALATAAGDPFT